MSQAIRDAVEAEFLTEEPLSVLDGDREAAWRQAIERRSYLAGGSLLAHGCKSAAMIAGFDDDLSVTSEGAHNKLDTVVAAGGAIETVDMAYEIGRHIGSAFQVGGNVAYSEMHTKNVRNSMESRTAHSFHSASTAFRYG